MGDPLTFAFLGGAVATEGIKFLFGQASEVLKAWRARREKATEKLAVPMVDNDVLDAELADAEVDAAVVGRQEPDLVRLVGTLAPYAIGIADVDPHDANLASAVHRLREILETAYGQRLTFRGEQRPATGTRIEVSQHVDRVEGTVTGVDAATIGPEADVAVEQAASDVSAGGSVTGVRADRLG